MPRHESDSTVAEGCVKDFLMLTQMPNSFTFDMCRHACRFTLSYYHANKPVRLSPNHYNLKYEQMNTKSFVFAIILIVEKMLLKVSKVYLS